MSITRIGNNIITINLIVMGNECDVCNKLADDSNKRGEVKLKLNDKEEKGTALPDNKENTP